MRTLEECIESLELMSSINRREKEKHADVLHYLCMLKANLQQMDTVQKIKEDAVRQRDAHIKALAELKSGGWISIDKQRPEKEGKYLTFCKYRNGSTDIKVKLWKPNYGFTSENMNVFYWMPLPKSPEVSND